MGWDRRLRIMDRGKDTLARARRAEQSNEIQVGFNPERGRHGPRERTGQKTGVGRRRVGGLVGVAGWSGRDVVVCWLRCGIGIGSLF